MTAQAKLERLRADLEALPAALVAYSGGVDSAFLLAVAREVLGARAVALTTLSPAVPAEEADAARALAESLGVERIEVRSNELADPRYAANPSNRCFFCKSELHVHTRAAAERLARERGVAFTVLDGTNADDLRDHRPGREAAAAAGVRSPLADAGLAKEEIRALSRERGLPTWDKPAAPCLASRIPYGTEVTAARLRQIGAAERALRALGFRELRVRWHDTVARIEVHPDELSRLLEPATRAEASRAVRACGFRFVAIDLDGFASGRLNVLAADVPPLAPGAPARRGSADPEIPRA